MVFILEQGLMDSPTATMLGLGNSLVCRLWQEWAAALSPVAAQHQVPINGKSMAPPHSPLTNAHT